MKDYHFDTYLDVRHEDSYDNGVLVKIRLRKISFVPSSASSLASITLTLHFLF